MRKRLAAGITAGALLAGSAGGGAVYGYEKVFNQPPKAAVITPGVVRGAALIIERECLGSGANGHTAKSGSETTKRVINRQFDGTGVWCRVVESSGVLLSVTVIAHNPADAPTGDTMTETFAAGKTDKIGGDKMETAWNYQLTASSLTGNSSVRFNGVASANGGNQLTVESLGAGQPTQLTPGLASLAIDGTQQGPNLSVPVFNATTAYAQEAMATVAAAARAQG